MHMLSTSAHGQSKALHPPGLILGKAVPLSWGSEVKALDMTTSVSATHVHSELYFLRASSTPLRHGNKFYTYDKYLKNIIKEWNKQKVWSP